MSSGGSGQGAIYSPLPQTISDTDSSEEELISIVQNNGYKKLIVSCRSPSENKGGKTMGEYRPLGHQNDSDLQLNGITNHCQVSDDVPIIKPDMTTENHPRPMSLMRKVFFILSILLCFVTANVFLWVLPCDWATCPAYPPLSSTQAWEKTLDEVELLGKISVVPGVTGYNLIFLFRGNVIHTPAPSVAERGGVVSLIGATGKVAWWKKLYLQPYDIDCSLIDLTGDNIPDCIIVGAGDLMGAFEPISGKSLWFLHSHQAQYNAFNIQFPLILPDLDEDGVGDLLIACGISSDEKKNVSKRDHLVLISGKMGRLLGTPLNVQDCYRITNIILEVDWNISCTCENTARKDYVKLIPVNKLYTEITKNPWIIDEEKYKHFTLKQHGVLRPPRNTHMEIHDIGEHRLKLMNSGKCPGICQTSVKILKFSSLNRGEGEQLFNYTGENTYAMVPATLDFKRQSLTGFVVKFWQWNDQRKESINSSTHRSRSKKSVPFSAKQSDSSNLLEHQLHERVVLITFNSTRTYILNTSQSEIIQLCNKKDHFCQPEKELQEESLLVTDLDGDGSKELISYLTTFPYNGSNWNLKSQVRVIRLEAELSKLYESDGH